MTLRDMTEDELVALTEAVITFGDTVTSLKQRRNRFIVGLIVSVCLDILLSIGLGVVALNANDTATTANRASRAAAMATSAAARIKDSERTRCEAGNEFRVADRARWEYVIHLSAPPTKPKAVAALTKFEHFINVADKTKPCT